METTVVGFAESNGDDYAMVVEYHAGWRSCSYGEKTCWYVDPSHYELVQQAKAKPPTTKYPDGNPKTAMGLAKPNYRCVPMTAVYAMGKVMTGGAIKYGPFNWRKDKITSSTYIDAARRHLDALADGTRIDPESGEPQEAHIMSCMALMLDARLCDKLIDDLPAEPGPMAKYLAYNTIKKAA